MCGFEIYFELTIDWVSFFYSIPLEDNDLHCKYEILLQSIHPSDLGDVCSVYLYPNDRRDHLQDLYFP